MLQLPRGRFYLFNIGVPALCGLAIFLMFDLTHLDVWISNWFFDPAIQKFPLDQSHLFETITHKQARIIPNWTGFIAVTGAVLSFVWPRLKAEKHSRIIAVLETLKVAPVLKFSTRFRRDFLFVALAFSVSTGFVHYFKNHTGVHCPIETTVYAGQALKQEWYENFSLLHDVGDGRCWPAGHASSGFTMLALYFVARRYRWRHAKAMLYGILLLGLVFGTTRVLQGWHYMSHTLWSGVLVWFSCLLTALAFYGSAALDKPPLAAHKPRVEQDK